MVLTDDAVTIEAKLLVEILGWVCAIENSFSSNPRGEL